MKRKILAVDDEKSILKLYSRLLTGEAYSVTTAENFTKASGLIEANNYDLLVTDLTFPDGLGTELISLFKKKCRGAKSILVTGAPEAEEIMHGSGITDYFQKPFDINYFMAAVKSALRG